MARGRHSSPELDQLENDAEAMEIHEMISVSFHKVNPHSAQARLSRMHADLAKRFKSVVGVDRIYIIRIK